jgi:hypothetical protein
MGDDAFPCILAAAPQARGAKASAFAFLSRGGQLTAAAAITNLRTIAAHLVARKHPLAAWFAAALAEYEASAPRGVDLGEAFGLQAAAGARQWWESERRRHRNEILRELAARHFPGLSTRAAADAIVTALVRYQATRWRRHRAYATPPAGLTALEADLFRLLKVQAPVSRRTVQRALGSVCHEVPLFVAHETADLHAAMQEDHECEHLP